MSEPTANNLAKLNTVIGWVTALCYVIGYIGIVLIGQIGSVLSLAICVADRETLKGQNKRIAWGWVLIPPVYMYKRAKVLNEGLAKFWVNLITMVIFLVLVVYASSHMAACMSQALPYFDNNQEIAAQFCQCTMGNTPAECLQKLF